MKKTELNEKDTEAVRLRRLSRLSGLGVAVVGGISAFGPIDNLVFDAAGVFFMLEGTSDFITGDHHYFSSRFIKYLSKGKINVIYSIDKYKK